MVEKVKYAKAFICPSCRDMNLDCPHCNKTIHISIHSIDDYIYKRRLMDDMKRWKKKE